MSKYFIKFLILFNVVALHCAEPVIPATNNQVRAFRTAFATEIAAQNCQYEAIGIFVFINKLVKDVIADNNIDETITERFVEINAGPLRIAEAVRLGYGFDRGVCSDLVVSSAEMNKYKAALAGIGKIITRDSQKAEIRHVFTKNATPAAIATHLNLSNALMYGADAGTNSDDHDPVKFMYAEAKYAGDTKLEEIMKFSEEKVDKGMVLVRELAQELLWNDQDDLFLYSRFGEFTEDEKKEFKQYYASSKAELPKEKIEEAVLRLAGWQPGTEVSPEQQMNFFPSNIKAFIAATKNLGYKFTAGWHIKRSFEHSFELLLELCANADVPEEQKAKYFRLIKTLVKKNRSENIPLSIFSEISAISAIPDDIFNTYLLAIDKLEPQDWWICRKYLSALKKRNAPLTLEQLEELKLFSHCYDCELYYLISLTPADLESALERERAKAQIAPPDLEDVNVKAFITNQIASWTSDFSDEGSDDDEKHQEPS